MLTISRHQMLALGEAARVAFEGTAAAHLRSLFPGQTADRDDAWLGAFVRSGIERAAGHGIDFESDVLRYLEYTVMYGSGFEEQAAFEWARRILETPGLSGRARLDRIDRVDMVRHT